MSISKVILISGPAGSGKSTTASKLVELYEQRGTRAFISKFAAPLYAMHDAALAVAKTYSIPVLPKERELLQLLGTDWGRATKGENVWVNAALSSLEKADGQTTTPTIVIFDDVRFENEVSGFIERLGEKVFTVRLSCSQESLSARSVVGGTSMRNHPSEHGLDDYAEKGLFNLYLDTSDLSPYEVAVTIRREMYEY